MQKSSYISFFKQVSAAAGFWMAFLLLISGMPAVQGQAPEVSRPGIPSSELADPGQFTIIAYYSRHTQTGGALKSVSEIDNPYCQAYLVDLTEYIPSLPPDSAFLSGEGIRVPSLVLFGPTGNFHAVYSLSASGVDSLAEAIEQILVAIESCLGSVERIDYFKKYTDAPSVTKSAGFFEVNGYSKVFRIYDIVRTDRISIVVFGTPGSLSYKALCKAILSRHFDSTFVDLYRVNLAGEDGVDSLWGSAGFLLWQLDGQKAWPFTYLAFPGGMAYSFLFDSVPEVVAEISQLVELAGMGRTILADSQKVKPGEDDQKQRKETLKRNKRELQTGLKPEKSGRKHPFVFIIDSLYYFDNMINLQYEMLVESKDEEDTEVYTICLEVRCGRDTILAIQYNFHIKELKNRTLISRDLSEKHFRNREQYVFYVALKKGGKILEQKEFQYLFRLPVIGEPHFETW